LIITRNIFNEAIQPLAEWKNKKGLKTKVISFENMPDTNIVKDSILFYNPEYVLLVGHTSLIPSFVWPVVTVPTDNYYADLNDDTLTDIYVGRFPARNLQECLTMVNRTLLYERTPYMLDTTWYHKGTTIANGFDTYYSTWLNYYRQNCMYARELMLNSGYSHVDTFFNPPPGYNPYNADSILQAVHDGRTYLLYRGEASVSWDFPFGVNPELTDNYPKYPFIVSGSCFTIALYGSANYSGEKWLQSGSETPTTPNGAVAYFGTTSAETYFISQYRGAVVCGLFKALFEEESLTTGSIAKRGKDSLYSAYGLGDEFERYIEWNLLGDPELNLWTAVPQTMVVTHDPIIHGSQDFCVTVKDQYDNPISNALVCVMMPNEPTFYYYGYTDNSGSVTFAVTPIISDSVWVTVTARNYHPYEGTCFAILDFLSDSPEATGFNQNRHLVRKPSTNSLHLVFHSHNRIFYSYSVDGNWQPVELIDIGKFPCISLDLEGKPWIAYLSPDNKSLNCAMRRDDGTWKKMFIFGIDACGEYAPEFIGQPSMVHNIYFAEPPMAYLVCSFNSSANMTSFIQFLPFDTITVVYPPPLDLGPPEDSLCNPCISITPGDILHAVWQRKRENTWSIYYKTTLEKVTPSRIYETQGNLDWSELVPVSTPINPITEPASNPSTETYGEYVYAAWRGPNENGTFPGDVWRRARRLDDPPGVWRDPQNKSETPDNESNYPVMSTDFVTVWQEQINDTNWDIWARFGQAASSQPIFETPKSSQFPHIAGYWAPTSVFICNTIWTEQIDTNIYEVRFGQYQYPPAEDYDNSYYSVEIGDTSPSPHCVERDGYFQYGSYSVDYSNQGLKYRLPYLNPQYSYLLRAIIYRTGQNNWVEDFYTDSTLTATALFEPNKPETVWFQLPKESYENTEVLQEIERIVGSHAVVADLRLYQFEVVGDSGGEGGQSAGSFSFQRPCLYQSFPNPFKFRANIRFQLPRQSKVSLVIYDITGRAVRKLLDEVKEPGPHAISWNGRDDRERILPQSIYFYRLRTNEFTDTKRIILIR
jgi:hypothetical protein